MTAPQDRPNRRNVLAALGLGVAAVPLAARPSGAAPPLPRSPDPSETIGMTTRYATQQVGEVEVFYREAGPADAPVLLLLHGFPPPRTCSAT